MSFYRLLPLLVAVGLLASLTATQGGDLPSDAAKRVKEFEAEVENIQKKADAEIAARRAKLLEDLQALAKAYALSGEANAAATIREHIRQLKASIEQAKNLIVNGSFEDGPLPGGEGFAMYDKGSTAIKGWVVSQGNLDYIDAMYWPAADGKRSLDMNGITAGGIRQTFKSKKGQKYRLTFSMAGNPNSEPPEKKLQVSAAGKKTEFTFDATGKTRTDMGWVRKTWEFTAEADETTLEFLSLMEGDAGAALDDVAVVAIIESLPAVLLECPQFYGICLPATTNSTSRVRPCAKPRSFSPKTCARYTPGRPISNKSLRFSDKAGCASARWAVLVVAGDAGLPVAFGRSSCHPGTLSGSGLAGPVSQWTADW